MKEFCIYVYELLNNPIILLVLSILMSFIVAQAFYRIYVIWKIDKEQEKKRNENISVSALDNNKDR